MEYIYVVLRDLKKGKYELERMTMDKYLSVKDRIDPKRLEKYVNNIYSPELEKYNIKNVVWDRVFDPYSKTYTKITVKIRDDFHAMDQEAETKKHKLEEKIRIEHPTGEDALRAIVFGDEVLKKPKVDPDEIVKDCETVGEALVVWHDCGYPFPAPHCIVDYKKDQGISWAELRDDIDEGMRQDVLKSLLTQRRKS